MSYHLAQINIGKFRLPVSDPANADFVNNLDRVNAAAEQQPGFVWRLKGDGNSAIDLQPFDDPNIGINMSVWTDLDSLVAFTYRDAAHRDIMKRRREWFERIEFYMALWWVPAGHLPTIDEGKAKIELLERLGPTADAFTFKKPFAAPDAATTVPPVTEECA
jgi:hypothetical protein